VDHQANKQKTAFTRGGDLDNSSQLSVTHEIQAPAVEEVLRAARLAIARASKTIKDQKGGSCGCF
jgi:hypothetical protein